MTNPLDEKVARRLPVQPYQGGERRVGKSRVLPIRAMMKFVLLWLSSLVPLIAIAHVSSAVSGMPNPMFTPGARNPAVTQADIRQTICRSGYSRSIRPPERYTEALKRKQVREYGYRNQKIWDYEEDHLLPLSLGGSPRSPLNLWPEPRYGKWSAHKKDELEYELYWRVCHGRMALRKARRLIVRHWREGFERYVADNRNAHSWHGPRR